MFVILSTNPLDLEFPFRAKKILSRKATVATDTYNSYTFTAQGKYNLGDYDSENDLVDSRPLKDGESFKFADNLQEVLFVSCHDLQGLYEVMDVSKTEKPMWVK